MGDGSLPSDKINREAPYTLAWNNLLHRYSLATKSHYMDALRAVDEPAVRALLAEACKEN